MPKVLVLDSCVQGLATACRGQLYDVVCLVKLMFVMRLWGLKTVMDLAVTAARDFQTPGFLCVCVCVAAGIMIKCKADCSVPVASDLVSVASG